VPDPEAPPPPLASVLIISHNRKEMLQRCLASVEKCADRERIEILVVDNGSSDGSAQLESEFPAVRFIRLPRNFGLTKALNIGIRAAAGEQVFFLHDDTEVSPEAVGRLAGVLEREPDAAAACPLLVTSEGQPAPQLAELPGPDRVYPSWRPAAFGQEPQPVEYASGAALMVRRYFLRAMRHIDERYGQHGSDAEVCRQIRHAGRKLLLVPSARVVHLGGGEPESALEEADQALAAAAFLTKHYGPVSGLKQRLGVILKSLLTFRLRRLAHVVSGQKIDGSQSPV
jgi:N-acetylglucosaminyl-diphospho-decaprenol L-rhamnosyltransferase